MMVGDSYGLGQGGPLVGRGLPPGSQGSRQMWCASDIYGQQCPGGIRRMGDDPFGFEAGFFGLGQGETLAKYKSDAWQLAAAAALIGGGIALRRKPVVAQILLGLGVVVGGLGVSNIVGKATA
jgi:hypothetical protein